MNNTLFSDSPVVGYGLILMIIYLIATGKIKTSVFLIIICIFALLLYFYRAPMGKDNDISNDILLAPSYGTVKAIKWTDDYVYVAIFLSPADIHQQYYPVNGRVIQRVYDFTGKFDIAFSIDKSRMNEKKIHAIDTKHGIVIVTQLAGLLVRAIVSDEEINVDVKAGTRFGMIKFGSRVDIAIPISKGFELYCKVGDKLIGGKEIIGHWVH